jgi:anti-sigma regulatory factor (Ser/Thr protein kinase)
VKEVRDQFDIVANPANAGIARGRLRLAAADAGFLGPALDDFEVAMGEALSNAIIHGSPSHESNVGICITFSVRTREFTVEITDQGHGFDPRHVHRVPGHDEVSGRGLKMMAALVDKAVLFQDHGGTTVRLMKRVPER